MPDGPGPRNGEPIAIVGLACRFPDASDPAEFLDLVLSRRRAFRRVPPGRLGQAGSEPSAPAADDSFRTEGSIPPGSFPPAPVAAGPRDPVAGAGLLPPVRAGLIEGWRFDRAAFGITQPAYQATDPAHWLALETAARALTDGGVPGGQGLRRDRTGVIIGNTLTGEVSRATGLRPRWPYVRRVIESALADEQVPAASSAAVLRLAEAGFLAPFPDISEHTLAGSLPSAIADRICGHFGFRGGGHVVDAAHSASLLAVASACSALAAGELDTAVAGGVDISLDPFELSGLAQMGVLATTGMRVYDARPTGFWPGEGCGLVVLMRAADARAAGLASYAQIMGWGTSSAGSPALSRPGSGSLLLALRRAYERAGIAPEDVQLIEGDGTGTGSGDLAELTSLAEIRGGAPGLAAIGSVKANIGHAKAAAGVAGLIKTVLSIAAGVIPPGTGCVRPHPLIASEEARLRVPGVPEPWPARTRLAGVSSVGPGGSSVHVVLRRDVGSGPRRRVQLPGRYATVTGGNRHRARRGAAARAAQPVAEGAGAERAKAAQPGAERADEGRAGTARAGTAGRPAIPVPATPPGAEPFVFSGPDRAAVTRELAKVAAVAPWLSDAELGDLACHLGSRDAAGPVRAGLAARSQDELARLASGAAGLLRDLAPGKLTADAGIYAADGAGGGVTLLFPGEPEITCLAGSLASLRWLAALGVTARAGAGHGLGELAGLAWAGCLSEPDAERLASQLSDAAAPLSSAALAGLSLRPPARPLYPGSSGRELTAGEDSRALLAAIPAAPEHFGTAVGLASAGSDLLVETGPGPDLARLAAGHCDLPAVSLPGSWDDPDALADATAALFAAGAVPGLAPLFAGRATRPIDIWRERTFITNPCETAWPVAAALPAPRRADSADGDASGSDAGASGAGADSAGARSGDAANGDAASRARDGAAADGPSLDSPATASPASTSPATASPASTSPATASPASTSPATASPATASPATASPASTSPATASPASTSAGGAAAQAVPPQQVAAAPARSPAPVASPPDPSPSPSPAPSPAPAPAPAPAPRAESPPEIEGAGPWVRCFVPQLSSSEPPDLPAGEPPWRVHAAQDQEFAAKVADIFPHDPASDVVLAAVAGPADPASWDTLLTAAAEAWGTGRLVVISASAGLSGFCASLHADQPALGITLIQVPDTAPALQAARQLAGVRPGRLTEVVLGPDGGAREPVMTAVEPVGGGTYPLGPADVILVTGLSSQHELACAASLAGRGAALAVLTQPEPDRDPGLAAWLADLRAAGRRVWCECADAADPDAVTAAVRELEAALGPVTAVVSGAAAMPAAPCAALSAEALRPRVSGQVARLATVLDCFDPGRLRLLLTFGSVTERYGTPGGCASALASAALAAYAAGRAGALPRCQPLHVAWPPWPPGPGEAPAAERARLLRQMLATPRFPGYMAIHGRVGVPAPPVIRRAGARTGGDGETSAERESSPAGRFLAKVQLHYPGSELIADTRIAPRTDPYLAEYRMDGFWALPAAMVLEAMAQAAAAVAGQPLLTATQVRLDAPVLVPGGADGEGAVIRVCAVRRGGAVATVLRCAETGFRLDHARAVFGPVPSPAGSGEAARAGQAARPATPAQAGPPAREGGSPGGVVDGTDLYGPVCFQAGRFRRVAFLPEVTSRSCRALVRGGDDQPWFGAGTGPDSAHLVLGSPGLNDAALQVLQACLPHRRLLLAGCESVTFSGLEVRGALQVRARRCPAGTVQGGAGAVVTGPRGTAVPAPASGADGLPAPGTTVRAPAAGASFMGPGTASRRGEGGEAWDVMVLDVTGRPVVAWHGLRVREAGPLGWGTAWHPALLAASLEGCGIELGLHPTLRVTVTSGRVPELEAATVGVSRGAPPDPGPPPREQRARADGTIIRGAPGPGTPGGPAPGTRTPGGPAPGTRTPGGAAPGTGSAGTGQAPVAWADRAAGRWQLDGFELTVQAAVPVACRWQAIEQPADDLPQAGADARDGGLASLRRQLAAWPAEPPATSDARFRVIAACLAAMGRKPGEPVLLEDGCDHGWVAVRTARAMVSCAVVEISGVPGPAAVAIASAAPATSYS